MTLEARGIGRYLPLFILPVLFLIGIIGLVKEFIVGQTSGQLFMIVWNAIVVYNGYQFINMVTRIDYVEGEQIVFNTITGKIHRLNPSDINSIKLVGNAAVFKTQKGRFISMGNFDGFSEFIVAIKKINPKLTTKGC